MPHVPRWRNIVADLNFDMRLPLWPLKTVYAPGQEGKQSGRGSPRLWRQLQGLSWIPDPLPDRNVILSAPINTFCARRHSGAVFKFGFAKARRNSIPSAIGAAIAIMLRPTISAAFV
jgi:hypothetical protein